MDTLLHFHWSTISWWSYHLLKQCFYLNIPSKSDTLARCAASISGWILFSQKDCPGITVTRETKCSMFRHGGHIPMNTIFLRSLSNHWVVETNAEFSTTASFVYLTWLYKISQPINNQSVGQSNDFVLFRGTGAFQHATLLTSAASREEALLWAPYDSHIVFKFFTDSFLIGWLLLFISNSSAPIYARRH